MPFKGTSSEAHFDTDHAQLIYFDGVYAKNAFREQKPFLDPFQIQNWTLSYAGKR